LSERLADPCPPKTRADLEWPRVLEALAERCVSAIGRDRARALPFPEAREDVRTALAESAEAVELHAKADPLPIVEVPDVREPVGRLRVGGTLGPLELRGVASAIGGARVLRRYLSTRQKACPALHAACSTDPTLDDAEEEIARSFESDGTLSDRASPRLRELRGEYQTSRARMLSRLEDLMNRYEGVLQDRFITEREGRYVIPVRSDAHERFPGIVHASSASASTIFVEPRAVVPMGNRLKMLEAEVLREETAIYTRLSSLLGDVLPSVEAALAAFARADVCAATAKLAEELALTFPEVIDAPRLDLKTARHPLLALESSTPVVPSDLAIASGRGMVVSGPNAGGKTVALKAMGLAVLMTRAGLPVACAGGSIGLFDVVLESRLLGVRKPEEAFYQLACQALEVRPSDAVFLDDLGVNLKPARAMGMHTIKVTSSTEALSHLSELTGLPFDLFPNDPWGDGPDEPPPWEDIREPPPDNGW